jgi:SAM-dependent methyltransferase
MGLSRLFLLELIEQRRAGTLDGATRVVEIGAHQLTNCFLRSAAEIAEICGLYGVPVPELGEAHDAGSFGGVELLHADAPPSEPFWRALGFSYAAIEYGGHRGATALDLNTDRVPAELRGRFDLLVNAGTTEHVANQDNAFRIMHDLTTPGGVMLHGLPAGGHLTHGFFNYTPKFFWRLAEANDYATIKNTFAYYAVGPIPDDLVRDNARWSKVPPLLPPEIFELYITAIYRKQHDRPYVTPLDIP